MDSRPQRLGDEGDQPPIVRSDFQANRQAELQQRRLERQGNQVGRLPRGTYNPEQQQAQPEHIVDSYPNSPLKFMDDPGKIAHSGSRASTDDRILRKQLSSNMILRRRRTDTHDEVDAAQKGWEDLKNRQPDDGDEKYAYPDEYDDPNTSKERLSEIEREAEEKYNNDYKEWQNEKHDYINGDSRGLIKLDRFRYPVDRDDHVGDLFRDYTGGGFNIINSWLRHGVSGDPERDKAMRLWVHHMYNRFDTDNGFQPWQRLVSGKSAERVKNLQKGDLIRDPGFMSVSHPEGYFDTGIGGEMISINAPYWSNARSYHVDPDNDSVIYHSNGEMETIFAPNTMLQYQGDGKFDAYAAHDLHPRLWKHLAAGRTMEDIEEFDGDLFDIIDDTMDVTRSNEKLQENAKQPKRASMISQAFADRMMDFQFEIVHRPGRKTFDDMFQDHDD